MIWLNVTAAASGADETWCQDKVIAYDDKAQVLVTGATVTSVCSEEGTVVLCNIANVTYTPPAE